MTTGLQPACAPRAATDVGDWRSPKCVPIELSTYRCDRAIMAGSRLSESSRNRTHAAEVWKLAGRPGHTPLVIPCARLGRASSGITRRRRAGDCSPNWASRTEPRPLNRRPRASTELGPGVLVGWRSSYPWQSPRYPHDGTSQPIYEIFVRKPWRRGTLVPTGKHPEHNEEEPHG